MKISKIKIKNLFGIEQLELSGKSIELTGKKGAGKTSVIDAIKYALTNKSDRDFIIKKGEKEGEIYIETSNGISIERKINENNSNLKVRKDGNIISSPQSFLNAIFTPMQLNPLNFIQLSKDEQNRMILDLIEFEWDISWIKDQFGEIPAWVDYNQHILKVLDDIQGKQGDYYKKREEINRKELYKRQQINDITLKFPANYDYKKWEQYSIADKAKEIKTIESKNDIVRRAKTFIEHSNDKIRGYEAEKEIAVSSFERELQIEKSSLLSTIKECEKQIAVSKEKLANLSNKL